VLLLLTDQQSTWTISGYHRFFGRVTGRRSYASADDVPRGEVPLATPHLDALMRRGTFFANFVVSAPWCVPSRGCLMTSRCAPATYTYTNRYT